MMKSPSVSGKRQGFGDKWEAAKFKRGVSGNPGGKPKIKQTLQMELEHALDEIDPKKRASNARVIIKAAITKAKAGSFKHLDLIFNRVHGKVAEKLEVKADIAQTITELYLKERPPK